MPLSPRPRILRVAPLPRPFCFLPRIAPGRPLVTRGRHGTMRIQMHHPRLRHLLPPDVPPRAHATQHQNRVAPLRAPRTDRSANKDLGLSEA
ncbi:hypothetical protein E2C01_007962 [Portunus trituberculatus]|uniref:Uncharacterized protein n=1 Tax=Portunus trituberculatus TaxID=210409 RepID=A0A5B7D125_PORTR|nr:hypothetical protein [Portunus trituberculatus]